MNSFPQLTPKNIFLIWPAWRCYSENNIEFECLSAKTSMLDRSNKALDEVEIGCNVVVPIPNVDRGKGDPKNIMSVVQSKTEKGYRLATKQGILLGSYTRNQFEPTDSLFLKPSDILADNFISFRQAVRLNSICDGHGFQKSGCSGKIVVSKIDVHGVKRASYITVDVTQTCLVKLNDHNITISYFE